MYKNEVFYIMYYYNNISKERKQKNISQQQVAQLLGITQQQYSLYESGKREIPVHCLIILSEYYGVTIDYLVSE